MLLIFDKREAPPLPPCQIKRVWSYYWKSQERAPDYPLSDPEYDSQNPGFLQEKLIGEYVYVH